MRFDLQVLVRNNEENLFGLDLSPPEHDESFQLLSSIPLVGVVIQEPPSFENIDLVEPLLHYLFLPVFVHF